MSAYRLRKRHVITPEPHKPDQLAHSDEAEAQRTAFEKDDKEIARRQRKLEEEDEDFQQPQSSDPCSSSPPTGTKHQEEIEDELDDEDAQDEDNEDEDDEYSCGKHTKKCDAENSDYDSDSENDTYPDQSSSPSKTVSVLKPYVKHHNAVTDDEAELFPAGF